jgi:hypothetical protein
MKAAEPTVDAQPLRRRLRLPHYSLRSLLLAVTLLCVALGFWVNGAERQRRAVAAVLAAGGTVQYEHEQGVAFAVAGEFPGPDWLCRLLGVDYFADVIYARVPPSKYSRVPPDVTAAAIAQVGGLTSLKALDLSETPLSDADLAGLSGLHRLKGLSLSGTQITDAGLAHVGRLTRLEVLWLGDTQVSDAGLAHLSNLSNLGDLYLYTTDVTERGCHRLQQELPNCHIDW